jgi:DNA mismatch repair protein MutL
VVLELSKREEDILKIHQDVFTSLGFEIDDFGDSFYALRAVPTELYGLTEKGLFCEILDELGELTGGEIRDIIEKKIAGAACKAAVKANKSLTREEFEALIDQLIELENPYFCPHGRPTMITMTKREIERKFKRV